MGKTELYRRHWTVAEPKGSIVLVHGQGEHSGRYNDAARVLNTRGYHVFSGDMPGHGRSPGIRGHIDAFDDYLDIVQDWVTEARTQSQGLPLFVLGHSVGGLITIRYLETRADASALAGAVLSSPALRLKFEVPAWKSVLGRALDRIAPRLSMPSGLKEQRVTRNEEVSRATAEDPYMVYVSTVRFYNELLRAQRDALLEAGRIRLPVLLLHGGADEIIEPSVSLELGAQLSSPDKEIRLLPSLHHEIINEPERAEVLGNIADWLDRRTSQSLAGMPRNGAPAANKLNI